MITPLLEILELPNFVQMTTSTIQFTLPDKILLVTSEIKIMTLWFYFQGKVILGRPEVVNFAGMIKITITLIKITSKASINIKRIWNYILKCMFFLFPYMTIVTNFWWKNIEQNSRVVSRDLHVIWICFT